VRKLHLKLYLAVVGTLIVFVVLAAVMWHLFASPRLALGSIESATGLASSMLESSEAGADRQREILTSLAHQLRADVSLYEPGLAPALAVGRPLALGREQIAAQGWFMADAGPVFNQALADGRHLVVHPRHQLLLHGLHLGLMLIAIAVTLALLTYPITRGITARLGRLQSGVLRFGAGDLAARVRVEGRDEVAALACSFNETAERVEKLVRAHQLLLANCSHELRTPLARIRLAIDRVTGTDSKASAELARSIAELDALIGEMLLSSRLDAASGIERPEDVDLLALVAEEASHFDLEAGGDTVTVRGDPMLLRRLVRNLLENARVHAGGATALRVERHEGVARLVVEDAGDGVPTIDRDRIFEPFHRASTATRSSGAGLGLSIVRQIARAHGGTVEYSQREDGGSRFVATLPRSAD